MGRRLDEWRNDYRAERAELDRAVDDFKAAVGRTPEWRLLLRFMNWLVNKIGTKAKSR